MDESQAPDGKPDLLAKYFAALPTDQIAGALKKKIDTYYDHIRNNGRLAAWRRLHKAYYRAELHGGKMETAGEKDELTSVSVNHLRNLLQHLVVMTTTNRPSFEPRAGNTDYESQQQAILMAGILDFFMREKRLEKFIRLCTERGVVMTEGWLSILWDQSAGDPVVPPGEGEPMAAGATTGDLKFTEHGPLEMVRDPLLESIDDRLWLMPRKPVNRYVLAAKYPALAEKLLAAPSAVEEAAEVQKYARTIVDLAESDDVAVYRFFHEPVEGLLPEGRYVEFVGPDIVLMDGPLPYKRIPIVPIIPAPIKNTPFSYSVALDLLPLQDAYDALVSTAVTNQAAFGVQTILVPKGHSIDIGSLMRGLAVIEYDPGGPEPKALQLTATPAEVFTMIEILERAMETLSGVNSVARGNPDSNLKSGSALALVQSMAIQFNSGLQSAMVEMLEEAGTIIVEILQRYAKEKRLAFIAGKSKRAALKEWSSEDIHGVTRVTVDMGNALSRTTAGRMNTVEMVMQLPTPEMQRRAMTVLETGQLEPDVEGPEAERLAIKAENEDLGEGKPVKALVTDDHVEHIRQHKSVLADPDARRDANIVTNALAHIQEHVDMASDPNTARLSMALGFAPMPPPPPPPMMGPPGAPPGMPPGPPGPGGGPPGPVNGAEAPIEPAMPAMPNLPTNPLTGEQAQVGPAPQ